MDEMKTTVRTLTFSTNYGCVCVQKGVAVCVGRAWTHHLACQPSVCLYCDTCLVVFVYRKVLLCVSVELEHITSPVSRKVQHTSYFVSVYVGVYTLWDRKTGPFSFEYNFRKYCLILIILSLLQTEIICPQMCYGICYFTYSSLLHYPLVPLASFCHERLSH